MYKEKTKIGILGGSFDPVHNGHISLSLKAIEEFNLKEVWLLPTFNPPHKNKDTLTDFDIRLKMLELVNNLYENLIPTDFEKNSKEKTYTYRILRELKKEYEDKIFYFIMGADSLFEIESWNSYETLLKENIIIVAGREYTKEKYDLDLKIEEYSKKFNSDIRRLHFEEVNVSASMLRQMRKNKENISAYLPKVIEKFIIDNNLYI